MTKKDLDLNGLVMEDIDFEGILPKITEELDKIEKECREKYGDDWFEHYVKITNPDGDMDFIEKSVNYSIFYGAVPFVSGDPEFIIGVDKRYHEKLKCLFGPFYKRHIEHETNDPKVNKLLIKDAMKTGK